MQGENARTEKVKRLRGGGLIRCLDLFAGCGGLSLGFQAAGICIVGAVESDPIAAKSHALNFHKNAPDVEIEILARARDITQVEPSDLVRELKLDPDPQMAVDLIVGGPPCQAFARVGRAKLREVMEHPEAFRQDPRGNLYLRYVHYVEKLQPLALLMENVPDVLNYGGHNIAEEMCEVFDEIGYACRYTLLNSAYYGVPQMRERMFLIAYAKELDAEICFPEPAFWVDLPRGYHGSRQVALKSVEANLFTKKSHYVPPPEARNNLPAAVTAREALDDLPAITLHLDGGLKRGARRFTEKAGYRQNVRVSSYAKLMKSWPGFENNDGVSDHVIRSLPRDYAIFARMNPGDQYPEAYQHALCLLENKLGELSTDGMTIVPGSPQYLELKRQIVPPYDPSKFPNKWRKMEADQPARTLMAHLGKDGYSHIHYDSAQARTISVREAARLQSFPDGFVFEGTMNPAFRQIGNAVPPLLAKAIGERMIKQLRRGEHATEASSKKTHSVRPDVLRVAFSESQRGQSKGHQLKRRRLR
ncbi:MAG: DNA cytosine methyltransferase [Blastocatellia bacterium]